LNQYGAETFPVLSNVLERLREECKKWELSSPTDPKRLLPCELPQPAHVSSGAHAAKGAVEPDASESKC